MQESPARKGREMGKGPSLLSGVNKEQRLSTASLDSCSSRYSVGEFPVNDDMIRGLTGKVTDLGNWLRTLLQNANATENRDYYYQEMRAALHKCVDDTLDAIFPVEVKQSDKSGKGATGGGDSVQVVVNRASDADQKYLCGKNTVAEEGLDIVGDLTPPGRRKSHRRNSSTLSVTSIASNFSRSGSQDERYLGKLLRSYMTDTTVTEGDSFQGWKNTMAMIVSSSGLSSPIRAQVWNIYSSVVSKHVPSCTHLITNGEGLDIKTWSLQIIKDLPRTSSHTYINTMEGQSLLTVVLLAFAQYNKDIGYCQSLNFITAHLMLVMDKDEDDTLRMLIALVELMPKGYYSDMESVSVDMIVFDDLFNEYMHDLHAHVRDLSLALSDKDPPLLNAFVGQWFPTLFSNLFPAAIVYRIWDCILFHGNEVLFRIGLAILKLFEKELLETTTYIEFYDVLKTKISSLYTNRRECESLMEVAFDEFPRPLMDIEQLRQLAATTKAALDSPFLLKMKSLSDKNLSVAAEDSEKNSPIKDFFSKLGKKMKRNNSTSSDLESASNSIRGSMTDIKRCSEELEKPSPYDSKQSLNSNSSDIVPVDRAVSGEDVRRASLKSSSKSSATKKKKKNKIFSFLDSSSSESESEKEELSERKTKSLLIEGPESEVSKEDQQPSQTTDQDKENLDESVSSVDGVPV
eukprot:Nk52_evm1s1453 gene=Nk52_evmTU1s1453